MGCIFFEGFNYSDSDYTTLDPTYWSGVSADASISKPDYGSYTFKRGRTSRAHVIPARDAEEDDILKSSSLMLSGFPAINHNESYYGLGCFISQIQTNVSGNGSVSPYREKLLSFYNGPSLIFDVNTTWMANSGIAIEVSGNGNGHSVEIPLYYAPVPEGKSNIKDPYDNDLYHLQERTYTITSENDRKTWRLFTPASDIRDNQSKVTDLCNVTDQIEHITTSAMYLEIFGQANDGTNPATTGTMHIKVDGSGITASTGISITGFNNFDRVEFHGTHHPSGECDGDSMGYGYYLYDGFQNEYRIIDDLYIASGTQLAEVNLGASVRIFRSEPNGTRNKHLWARNQDLNIATEILNSNDNQTWIGANIDGAICINSYENINNTNDVVEGIKITNIDQSDDGTRTYSNVMVSGTSNDQGGQKGPFVSLGLGQERLKTASSTRYKQNNSFVFTNPTTNTNWTLTDIQTLKMGVIVGDVTADCEDNGGYIIQDAGLDAANGIYCDESSGGSSIQSNFLKTYRNTKDNGYYISYDNTGDSNAGWYIRDGSDNKIYKNNVVAGTKAPMLNWSLSDYGVFPAPNPTTTLNLPHYSNTSPQKLDYTP